MTGTFSPLHLFCNLYRFYGPQGWWPATSLEEMAWGAILTQAVNWHNASLSLQRLRERDLLHPTSVFAAEPQVLAEAVHPSGYHRVKALKLQQLASFWLGHPGGLEQVLLEPTPQARRKLLGVWGVGPETADSILLYGGNHPVMVVDAYTARIAHRHGWADANPGYQKLQALFSRGLPADPQLLNEFHALLVRVGKTQCRRGRPLCDSCPLAWLAPP